MLKENIIIDCDPGHDDAVALMMAIANKELLNILCVSTVGGNQEISKVTKNTQNILDFLGVQIPLVEGQARPLVCDLETGENAHGDTGLNGPVFNENNYPVIAEHAQPYLYNLIMDSQSPVTIVALGPLTNIALLVINYPEIVNKIKQIVIMGGGIDKGNVTASAEFNIYVDPHAAKITFDSGIPIVMAGLNITEKCYIEKSDFDEWQNKGDIHHLYWEILSFYYESGKQFGFENSAIHDAVPMAYLLKPEIFKGSYYPISVVLEGEFRGTTIADKRLLPENKNSVFVLEEADRVAFKDLIDESLATLDEERSRHVN